MSKSNAQKAREAAIADVQGMGIRAMILGGEYPVVVDDAVVAAKALNALAEAIRASAPARAKRKAATQMDMSDRGMVVKGPKKEPGA